MSFGTGSLPGRPFGPVFLSRQPDADHRAVWEWLSTQLERYPEGRYIAPLRASAGRQRRRTLYGASLTTVDVAGTDYPQPRRLDVSTQRGTISVQLTGGADDAALIAQHLFTHQHRGAITAFPNGARRDLHVLVRAYRRAWVELGYRIKPISNGTVLMAVVVQRNRHAWYLADVPTITGEEREASAAAISAAAGGAKWGADFAVAARVRLERYQETLWTIFGVQARLTLGMSAVAAGARHIPNDRWLWRPPPDMVALCRAGGGYRGGYVWYPPYRGGAHKCDLRRAYTWALGTQLPVRAALGYAYSRGSNRDGIYVCRVTGTGTYPVYLSVWSGHGQGFRRRLFSGGTCMTILPSAEFPGLRALGYQVTPGWGYVFTRTTDLGSFVELLERTLAAFGPDSLEGQLAKRIANAFYGKLAERPERMEVVFAGERPGRAWYSMLDPAGEEVADTWCREVRTYRAHQHVDVAAVITARVRSRLYESMALLDTFHVRVLVADTDGLLTDVDPRRGLKMDRDGPGEWRYEGYDPDVRIAGPRFAVRHGGVIVAGSTAQDASVVTIAMDRGSVTVESVVMAPPWQDGAMLRRTARTLRRARDAAALAR